MYRLCIRIAENTLQLLSSIPSSAQFAQMLSCSTLGTKVARRMEQTQLAFSETLLKVSAGNLLQATASLMA